MRRALAVVATVVAAFLLLAPAARAAESIPSGNWAGSSLNAGPSKVEVGSYQLSGTFRRGLDRQVEVTVSASPAGSGACAVKPTKLPWANTPRSFNVTLAIPCNGTYTLVAKAATTDDNFFLPHDEASLDRQVKVAAPAPTVTGVEATAEGRAITVSWDDMVGAAPDLAGYVVERKIGDGDFEELATADAATLSYDDTALPAAAGEATYRVFATRPSPDGDKVSAASDEAATPFVAAPRTTDSSGTGSDTGTGTGSGTGTGTASGNPSPTDGFGSTGPDGQPVAGGSGTSGGSRGRVSPPKVFSGTFLPPLLRPASQAIQTTPTTADPGYEDALPYGDREQGAEDPVLPSDGMASIFTDGQPGRGMAIPVATALVLLVWALHLRMLARAARPLD
jgi:hypothetical protein